MKSNKTLSIFILTIALFLGVFSYLNFNRSATDTTNELGGDFSIPIEGGNFSLGDYREKVVLLYFGYASCPDVCPTALALTGNILKTMPENITAQVQPVFISVDPARDDLEKLQNYGRYFHPKMISGTHTKTEIDKLVRQYGAFYSINNQEGSAMGYTVDHTSRLYVIDGQGKLAKALSHADIQPHLSKTILQLTEN